MSNDKLKGEDRRSQLIAWLMKADKPLSGSILATKTNVSRQVIVQDMSLLKASGEPIMATAQGYIYLKNDSKKQFSRVIAANHSPEETTSELITIVDYGVTVEDVTVEHPVYGDIKASLKLSTRKDVEDLIQRLKDTNASLLSELTEGIHMHTLSSDSEEKLDKVCGALKEKGFLL
ncbi:transcription repressor NadR [Fictibacillus sp. 5RED26]|uniref:transcription repressor NadR n=1 Tax=Fictibacillus TaxID=1329200 RepID=UPI0018CFC50B|nr:MULTISPECIES: transcription repressor NadR [unclassified Fictibacillus]MBH0157701.1 transcription repressor NadR [Fictibacillus sp. 5RED26]MBH0175097.1 transcription repressor NadR [Fictibacillus sp. 23RED33]